ncbi:bifunctional GMP synthase/glutamine amidotransferase protein [mine drainage metagenome]|uniref:GMP synthase (glutamine-hydrolyzing) n=1 Tax=mine drainage metagenome TaxID=410659 RepID=T1AKU3_9ZZZZ
MPVRDPAAFETEALEAIRRAVPSPGKAIIAASGGIDSTVAAVLVQRALGERAQALFVDTGLLREGEAQRTAQLLGDAGVHFELLSRAERFFQALRGVTDPEAKRKAVGTTFIRIFEEEAARAGADHLVQGTIAPDWIESGGNLRDTIKTHHNVGGLPRDLRLKLVEPLRDLYKDEVRALARHLKVPEADRQPFPGPGLAVRVVGEVTPDRAALARLACAAVEEEVDRAVSQGVLPRPWQYFATLLPVRTVGVEGDVRTYGEAVSVRVVDSRDAMTATAMPLPPEVARRLAERITRASSGRIIRVLLDLTDKPPATIEWE